MRAKTVEVDGFIISVNFGTLIPRTHDGGTPNIGPDSPPSRLLLWIPPDEWMLSKGGECAAFYSSVPNEIGGWELVAERLNEVLHEGTRETALQTEAGNEITKTILVTIEKAA